ncbi:hypothetical protein M153_1398000830 [Pseudoloma neurophilia]|uniref:Uncharacterized protein n=1 Tax=Pseudoloma neurophilia TaxID=146866 RepID=A0A0R0M197_9MICR|nr:hypothetical protein M153_1398000830 [Pseudoloma neurophilia]
MYKKWDISQLKIIIENRINQVVNMALKQTPEAYLNGFLKSSDKEKYINDNPNVSLTNLSELNGKKIHFDYIPEQEAHVKNFIRLSKLDPFYCGQLKILEVSNDRNNICLEIEGKHEWHNVKNIKPYLRG